MNSEFAPLVRRRKEKRRIWRRAVTALSLCVAGVTAYALMRPASTKAKTLVCPLPEHEHSASCYAAPTFTCTYQPHLHTEACRDPETGDLLCGQSDLVLHEHDQYCFDADGSLTCSLPEKKEHTHTAECWTEVNEPICGLIECGAHEHTETCYTEQPILVCENAEEGHEHDESCYQSQHILTCTLPVSEGHVHTESCYGEPTYVLTCGEEELHFHEHTAACYDAETGERICGETELLSHQHTDCWLPSGELVCAAEEHTHTDGCYEELPDYDLTEPTYCGLGEHQHSPACYDGAGELHCTIPEHTHEESCYFPVQPTEPDAVEEEQPALLGEVGLPETLEQLDAIWAGTPEDLRPALLTAWLSADGESFETLLAQYEVTTADELFALLRASYDVGNITTLDGESSGPAYFAKTDAGAYQATLTFTSSTAGTCTITVETGTSVNDASIYDGAYITVSENIPAPGLGDHGYVTIDSGFSLQFYKGTGESAETSDGMTYTIESEKPLTGTASPVVYYYKTDSISGKQELTRFNSSQIESAVLSDNNCKLVVTTPNGFTPCLPIDIFVDQWQARTTTFAEWNKSHGIAYILQNYNVFVEGNYKGTHVVGPMVVGGVASMTGNIGGTSTSPYNSIPHTVPSYIYDSEKIHEQGKKPLMVQNDNPEMPVFFGTPLISLRDDIQVQARTESGNPHAVSHDNYYFLNDGYIDFEQFFADFKTEADNFVASSTTTEITSDYLANLNQTASPIPAGHVYTVPDGTTIPSYINLDTSDTSTDTIFVLYGENPEIPYLMGPNNTYLTDPMGESGEGTGIVFYCPDATTVTVKNSVVGHIIAPNAFVDLNGGNFNGCVIAKSMDAHYSEGHMFPYRGHFLVGKTGFTATKYLDGAECPSGKTFSFVLEYWHDTDNEADGYQKGDWQHLETVQNSGSEIIFSQRTYSKDEMDDKTTRDFIYRIREVAPDDPGGILYDSTIYYVKVTATLNGSSITVSDPEYYTTMDETTGALSDLITTEAPVFHNRTSYELPETGGPALWLTLAGALLVSLSAICLIPRRRKERA